MKSRDWVKSFPPSQRPGTNAGKRGIKTHGGAEPQRHPGWGPPSHFAPHPKNQFLTSSFYSKRENYMGPISKASDVTHVTSSKAIQKKT